MKAKILVVFVLTAFLSFQSYGKGGTNAVVFDAAAHGDVAKLKEFFITDTNLFSLRNSLLRTAALNGQKDTVEFLIALGAEVNEKGFFDMAPLAHMAMYGTTSDENCAEVATVLLAAGADVDPVDQYGATPLLRAVEMKKIKLARLLLEHGASPARKFDGTYYTPLHYAMRERNTEMIKLLLDFKASTEIVDPDQTTPLMRAVSSRNYEIARLLLEHGAKIIPPRNMPVSPSNSAQYWPLKNYNMETPLLRAVTSHDKKMVVLLLEFKAPLDAVDQDGKTPLHWAVELRDKEIVRLLLDAKSSLDVVDRDGATPLFLAETSENNEISKILRQAASAQGVPVSGVTAPSREAMRAIAKRICDGDTAAFDDLANTATELYKGDWRQESRRRLNADRMSAAFNLLGEEAGKGNDNAFQALKKCLGDKLLKYSALDPLGVAAAAGHQESLEILLDYKRWGILENSVCFALTAPAKAGVQPAVDFFIALALDPNGPKKQYYGVSWLVKEVLEGAAAEGNAKAKDALEKFTVVSARQNN